MKALQAEAVQIRAHRLRAHHLEEKIPAAHFSRAAGACGLQNSPPGAWETALFNRLEGCALKELHAALYQQKSLLQAWSYRGVPVVFPAGESGVFLTPLMARAGEEPWIYTRGITLGLDYVGMAFDEVLPLVQRAALHLDDHTVKSKEALDRVLAEIVGRDLPAAKRALWGAPSMYGSPERQTVGGAIVSFMLRPCSFASLVVFGRREGISPTFVSFKSWLGREAAPQPDGGKALVRKFLHCYGPATQAGLAGWLGCSPQQAKRLWNGVAGELLPVQVEGQTRHMLAEDRESLLAPGSDSGQGLALLGPHDPYLDGGDKGLLLANKALHTQVWRTVANPGVVLKGGHIAGIWKTKTTKGGLTLAITLWEGLRPRERKTLEGLCEAYAAFRNAALRGCTILDA